MARSAKKERLDMVLDGFNRQDVEAILSYVAEDCEWLVAHGPNAPEEEAATCVVLVERHWGGRGRFGGAS